MSRLIFHMQGHHLVPSAPWAAQHEAPSHGARAARGGPHALSSFEVAALPARPSSQTGHRGADGSGPPAPGERRAADLGARADRTGSARARVTIETSAMRVLGRGGGGRSARGSAGARLPHPASRTRAPYPRRRAPARGASVWAVDCRSSGGTCVREATEAGRTETAPCKGSCRARPRPRMAPRPTGKWCAGGR